MLPRTAGELSDSCGIPTSRSLLDLPGDLVCLVADLRSRLVGLFGEAAPEHSQVYAVCSVTRHDAVRDLPVDAGLEAQFPSGTQASGCQTEINQGLSRSTSFAKKQVPTRFAQASVTDSEIHSEIASVERVAETW